MRQMPNKRGAGPGGFAVLWRAGRDWTPDGAFCLHFDVLGRAPLTPNIRSNR